MNTTNLVLLLLLIPALLASTAEASVGLTEIAGKDGDGIVTVYYPLRLRRAEIRELTARGATAGPPVPGVLRRARNADHPFRHVD